MQGVLGLGTGKAAELAAAVKKANARAMKNLFYVPRYNRSTIFQTCKGKFGAAKVIMYPRSTNHGIKASPMATAICTLAGMRDIGVKVSLTECLVGGSLPCCCMPCDAIFAARLSSSQSKGFQGDHVFARPSC